MTSILPEIQIFASLMEASTALGVKYLTLKLRSETNRLFERRESAKRFVSTDNPSLANVCFFDSKRHMEKSQKLLDLLGHID